MNKLIDSKQFLILTLEIMARAPAGVLPYAARNYARTRRQWLRDYRKDNVEGAELNTGLRAAVRDELADKIEADAPQFTFSPVSVKTYAPRRTDRGAKYR
jgi:hypothetical protein